MTYRHRPSSALRERNQQQGSTPAIARDYARWSLVEGVSSRCAYPICIAGAIRTTRAAPLFDAVYGSSAAGGAEALNAAWAAVRPPRAPCMSLVDPTHMRTTITPRGARGKPVVDTLFPRPHRVHRDHADGVAGSPRERGRVPPDRHRTPAPVRPPICTSGSMTGPGPAGRPARVDGDAELDGRADRERRAPVLRCRGSETVPVGLRSPQQANALVALRTRRSGEAVNHHRLARTPDHVAMFARRAPEPLEHMAAPRERSERKEHFLASQHPRPCRSAAERSARNRPYRARIPGNLLRAAVHAGRQAALAN